MTSPIQGPDPDSAASHDAEAPVFIPEEFLHRDNDYEAQRTLRGVIARKRANFVRC